MSTFTLKTGDLEPALLVECLSDGRPLDLSAALSARVVVTLQGATVAKVDAAAEILDDGTLPTRGRVRYVWQGTDTDTAGTYEVEVKVTWSVGREQTFPGSSTLPLKIEASL